MLHDGIPFAMGVPIWRHPLPEESAHGLLLRITDLNGYQSTEWTAQCMGFRRSRISYGDVRAIKIFAEAICCDYESLARSSPIRDSEGNITVHGVKLTKFMQTSGLRRACPDCFVESLHHRFWWDILPITTCPRHNQKLVDHCRCNTDAHLSWRSKGLLWCNCCGRNDIGMIPREPADADIVRADRYLLSRFGIMSSEPVPVLDRMNVWDALDTLERIGAAAAAGYSRKWQSTQSLEIPLGKLQARGFAALADDKLGEILTPIFDDYVRQGGKPEKGFSACYGWLYRWFNHKGGAKFSPTLAEQFLKHGAERFPIVAQSQLGMLRESERKKISLKSAARQCGISVFAMRNIGLALGIIRTEKRPGLQISFSVEEVEKVSTHLKSACSLSETQKSLGVGHRIVHQLIQAGVLRPVISGGSKHKHEYLFQRHDVLALHEKLLQHANVVKSPPKGFICLTRLRSTHGVGIVDTIRAILAGKLIRCEKVEGVNGLPSFYVDAETARQANFAMASKSGLSLVAAARRMRLNGGGLKKAIKHGLLPGVSPGQRRIPSGIIEDFCQKYMMLVEVREHIKGTPKDVKRLLLKHGFKPEATLVRCRHVGYPRTKMETFLQKVESGTISLRPPDAARKVLLAAIHDILSAANDPISTKDLIAALKAKRVRLGPSDQRQFLYATLWEERSHYVNIEGAGWWIRKRPYDQALSPKQRDARVEAAVIQLLRVAKKPMPKADIIAALRSKGIEISAADPDVYLRKLAARRRDDIARLTGLGYWVRSRPYPPALYDSTLCPTGIQTNWQRIGAWVIRFLGEIGRPASHDELLAMLDSKGIPIPKRNTRDYLNDALGHFRKQIVVSKNGQYRLKWCQALSISSP